MIKGKREKLLADIRQALKSKTPEQIIKELHDCKCDGPSVESFVKSIKK